MDEFETETDERALQESPPTPPRWTGAPSIALAHQLNVQCLDILCELATGSADPHLPPFILQNRDLWRRLDTEARTQLAAFPFVIVDLHFNDARWWREMTGKPLINVTGSTLFSDLLLETLLFARQAAREDVGVAKTMFAMTSRVAELMASLTLAQVRAIAAGNSRELRVRWEQDPQVWRGLLIAALTGDQQAMGELRLQAKLLFCGELVRKPGEPAQQNDGQ
jgi:hypothetical protein